MNISGKNFKAVIFDLDNTLADRKYAFEMHSKKLAEMYLKNRSDEEKEAFVRRMIELDKNGYASKSQVYGCICREFSPDGTPEELFARWQENASIYTRPEPYAEETLIYLKDKYKLSLLTNGFTKTQSVKLDTVGLRKYFEKVIISEETGTEKPDREIYLLICRETGVIPEEALYIGDHLENDVKGPVSAGMSAVLYDRYGKYNGVYENTVSSLRELMLYL